MPVLSPFAKRVIPLLDLTNLDDGCTATDVETLCERAKIGVAAVCVWPQFVDLAKANTTMRVATVVNFPEGALSSAVPETKADEIDFVFPWKTFQAGQETDVWRVMNEVKEACGDKVLKVILESGAFSDMNQLRAACDLCIDTGADFLKTSTGKYEIGATPEAVKVLCASSRAFSKQVGVKVSGFIRTPEQVKQYLDIIADLMGLNWIEPNHVRIGASKLLDALEA